MKHDPPHPLVSLVTACFSVIFWVLSWIKTTVAFITITIPVWIYAILSYTLTLRLNFVTLVTLFGLSLSAAYLYYRYKYLTIYADLKELPLGKPDIKELHPDAQGSEDQPTTFHGYLDEFLAAVRIFGFLEKPVFHELARHLQTRRLLAGDSLPLDQDQNFYCVVEGLVQVYAPSGQQNEGGGDNDAWAEDDMNGHQLLNEVSSGGTLSSLFTILSLFTEDVKLRWQEDDGTDGSRERERTPGFESQTAGPQHQSDSRQRSNSDVSQFELSTREATARSAGRVDPRLGNNVMSPPMPPSSSRSSSSQFTQSPTPISGSYPQTPRTAQPHLPSGAPMHDRHPSIAPRLPRENSAYITGVRRGLIARASQDSTLAVIPAEAFRRLTKKFPKASAHIVQVILTRFSRVTFNAAHKYLGLTTEVLRTEKAINDLARHPLPASFYEGGGMQNLRSRFTPDVSDDGAGDEVDETMTSASTLGVEESDDDYFGYESQSSFTNATPGPTSRARSASRGSSYTDNRGRAFSPNLRTPLATRVPPPMPRRSSVVPSSTRSQVSAGDLHTTGHNQLESSIETYRPRGKSTAQTPGLTRNSRGLPSPLRKFARLPHTSSFGTVMSPTSNSTTLLGDIDLRDEVMACIAKSIGLIQPPMTNTPSVTTSPTLAPLSPATATSGGRPTPMFPNSFSTLSLLDNADDATSSVTGTSVMNSGHPYATGLDNEVEILCFPAGAFLVKAGERNAGLFYVIDGFLDVSLPAEESTSSTPAKSAGLASAVNPGKPSKSSSSVNLAAHQRQHSSSGLNVRWGDATPGPRQPKTLGSGKPQIQVKTGRHLFTVNPGGIAGYLASLTSTPSYVDIRSKVDTYVGFLPHQAMERLIERRPIVLLTLSKRLISLLSPLVLHIDSSLDWMQVNAGQVLWRPGDASDSFYIVINGRLRALAEKDGEIVGEYGQGDTVGELDVITSANRTSTLHAIRDTELARMPQTLFNAISIRHPQAAVLLLRMIASRVRSDASHHKTGLLSGTHYNKSTASARANFNLKTVAILPASRNVPVAAFAKKLHAALEDIGAPTSYLNQASMMSYVGRHAFTRMGKLKVAGWLAEQEQRYRTVLYVADSPVSAPWTQTCIRQADYIMVVGMANDPTIGEYERLLLTTKTTARKELVLLHPDRNVTEGSTREWLKVRPWVHSYIHVELPGIIAPPAPADDDPAAVKAFINLRDKVRTELRKYRGPAAMPASRRPDHLSDFRRLARRLCGKSIGLVLGGGGARGIAHLGVLKAFEERSIPVDHIGGTSIGALVGGLYAREGNLIATGARVKAFSARMSNIWRMLSDVTWPVVAYTTGHEFNRGIFKALGALHIEDMWLPYFCNSTNILTSRMEVHETGYAWRYVRASMTLVGLLPPLSDNGNMLVDGGYLDNMPVSTMTSMGPSIVFAVDVGSLDDNSPRNFDDSVSGFKILLNRFNPFSTMNIPAITEIQSRLAYLEEAKASPGCFYIQPPVQAYGTMQFGKYEELVEIGYKAGIEALEKWREDGALPNGFEDESQGTDKSRKKKGRSLRRNSI
ncbi:phosphatidylcholine and lysophosphatidylcholine phospholipase [Tulasnella sp. 330]|nr:phosphatidylcholine and lysophosphatidylcholine phospholipase [Tulasnella sp. 330]